MRSLSRTYPEVPPSQGFRGEGSRPPPATSRQDRPHTGNPAPAANDPLTSRVEDLSRQMARLSLLLERDLPMQFCEPVCPSYEEPYLDQVEYPMAHWRQGVSPTSPAFVKQVADFGPMPLPGKRPAAAPGQEAPRATCPSCAAAERSPGVTPVTLSRVTSPLDAACLSALRPAESREADPAKQTTRDHPETLPSIEAIGFRIVMHCRPNTCVSSRGQAWVQNSPAPGKGLGTFVLEVHDARVDEPLQEAVSPDIIQPGNRNAPGIEVTEGTTGSRAEPESGSVISMPEPYTDMQRPIEPLIQRILMPSGALPESTTSSEWKDDEWSIDSVVGSEGQEPRARVCLGDKEPEVPDVASTGLLLPQLLAQGQVAQGPMTGPQFDAQLPAASTPDGLDHDGHLKEAHFRGMVERSLRTKKAPDPELQALLVRAYLVT
ncbi:hypothetical protein VOLCADRAFT_94372 [Volvox carteri f. nagariensis]|uniref:Uncharacterized protein n=1 Tax=Volvox carteri f. nagariensis TaxID=3068 RepID=D8U4L9_VOLCA|nr:uncharacterized protein VOLCADRAFT_94372 [Volvox carteri f. nagariensis]EFJ45213.1 hypothetical protein VOLCADRAFT_94372 [Volvox carteri f. nagariensis]|eukprot:XP_002953589.1 hypothetical protein VOLCADRAFT_94372 [Volvox carteri f. nagariensis]